MDAGRNRGRLGEGVLGPVARGAGDGAVRAEPRIVEQPAPEPDLGRRDPRHAAKSAGLPSGGWGSGRRGFSVSHAAGESGRPLAARPRIDTRRARGRGARALGALDASWHPTESRGGRGVKRDGCRIPAGAAHRASPRFEDEPSPSPLARTCDEPREPRSTGVPWAVPRWAPLPAPPTPTSSAATPGRAPSRRTSGSRRCSSASRAASSGCRDHARPRAKSPMCNPGRAGQPPHTQVLTVDGRVEGSRTCHRVTGRTVDDLHRDRSSTGASSSTSSGARTTAASSRAPSASTSSPSTGLKPVIAQANIASTSARARCAACTSSFRRPPRRSSCAHPRRHPRHHRRSAAGERDLPAARRGGADAPTTTAPCTSRSASRTATRPWRTRPRPATRSASSTRPSAEGGLRHYDPRLGLTGRCRSPRSRRRMPPGSSSTRSRRRSSAG